MKVSTKTNMFMLMHILTFTLVLVGVTECQKLFIHSPSDLANKYPKGISIKLSPIGFNPLSGQLDGTLLISSPFDACSSISIVQNALDDVFIFVNDQVCLQSVKAKNIMKAGGIVGIMRENYNTTLHDKQINLVHIPIAELSPQIFDDIIEYQNSNTSQSITLSIQFSKVLNREISTQLWMSPTQTQTYAFLINIQQFLTKEANEVDFTPRYALHSQKQRKTFIGCYSNGMYCPGQIKYDGKLEGQNVVEQTLRQIVIRDMNISLWWTYIKFYYVQCLHQTKEDVFMSSQVLSVCSRNSMILANIDYAEIDRRMYDSFLGNRKEVDDNLLLRQQRQYYTRQMISTYPVMLINKKEIDNIDQTSIKSTICKMEHTRSQTCSRILNGDLEKVDWFIIFGFIIFIIVIVLIGYKVIMNRRMQKQMKSQVTNTLEQYYRYMDTLDNDNSSNQPKIQEKPQSMNRFQQMKKKSSHRQQDVEIELGKRQQPFKKTQKISKDGHETLVEQGD